MGLGSEENVSLGNIEVKRDKSVVFGGQEGLPKRFLELSLNEQGNPRIRRLEGANFVSVWGLMAQGQTFVWEKWKLVETLPDKVYERIDGRPVVIDIQVPRKKEPTRLLRLNHAAQSPDSRLYRIEINPLDRDLTKRN